MLHLLCIVPVMWNLCNNFIISNILPNHQVLGGQMLDSAIVMHNLDINCVFLNLHFIFGSDRFIETHIETLKPLFKLDPLLPVATLYFCPRKEVSLLCAFVPVHLTLARITRKLQTTLGYYDDFRHLSMEKVWCILIFIHVYTALSYRRRRP